MRTTRILTAGWITMRVGLTAGCVWAWLQVVLQSTCSGENWWEAIQRRGTEATAGRGRGIDGSQGKVQAVSSKTITQNSLKSNKKNNKKKLSRIYLWKINVITYTFDTTPRCCQWTVKCTCRYDVVVISEDVSDETFESVQKQRGTWNPQMLQVRMTSSTVGLCRSNDHQSVFVI